MQPDLLEEGLRRQIDERQGLLDRVRRLLIEQLHIRREPDEIDPDCSLFATGLGLDSVDAVELVVALEAEFQITLKEGPLARRSLRTVNTLVDTILEHRCGALQEEVSHGA